jgi:predicted nucleotidyltransferase
MNIDIDAYKIFEGKSGSHLYGTSTPTSDVDYVGIVMPPEDCIFGLLKVEEINLDIKSKSESGKNNKDAIDRKFYELRNFAKLALQNNPNILEILWVNSESIIFKNEYYDMLHSNAQLFLNKESVFTRFISYSSSQKHKMVIKEKHFSELSAALDYFEGQESHSIIVEFREKGLPFLGESINYFIIGDLNFQKHARIKKVLEILRERMSKISNRYELVTKYGYDTKFSMHLIRLLLEGKELLKTGEIVFPLKDRKFLLDIRSGKYKIEEILSISTQLENEMRDTKDRSILSNQPRFKEINDLIKKITKNFLIR